MYNHTEAGIQSRQPYQIPKPSAFYTNSVSRQTQSEFIAKKGFNPAEADLLNKIDSHEVKKRYLQRNLETTINHVFEDSVVSFANCYRLNSKGEIVTHPDNVVVDIDPDERGGLYSFGLTSAVDGALRNPNQVVLLYSPPGPVVFDNNPENKFCEVKPYTIGQLYIMHSDNSGIVHNVAVSISPEAEDWVEKLMPGVYKNAVQQQDVISAIKSFITSPVLLSTDIDMFLNHTWNNNNRLIYKNKDGVEFSLAQTLDLVKKSLSGELPQSHIVKELMQQIDIRSATPQQIGAIYDTLAQRYMAANGLETMKLGGSCGGTELTRDLLLGFSLSNLASDFRMLTQGGIARLFKTIEGIEKILHCTCPFCNKEVDAQIKNGHIRCPECKEKAPYSC